MNVIAHINTDSPTGRKLVKQLQYHKKVRTLYTLCFVESLMIVVNIKIKLHQTSFEQKVNLPHLITYSRLSLL